MLILFFVVGQKSIAFCGVEDSTKLSLSKIPNKYLKEIDNKFSKYHTRVSDKTIKTLQKLSKWENKIKGVLEKVSPETVQQLFGNPNHTFSGLLAQLQKGERLMLDSKVKYFDTYRDKVTTNLKYLQSKKAELDSGVLGKIKAANEKFEQLNEAEEQMQVVQDFIKERKQELIKIAFKHLGQNKYLQKINKESWYYVETLKNYKAILSDPTKTEETVRKILQSIPAFQKFFNENSYLSSLFGQTNLPANSAAYLGLQTRSDLTSFLQTRLGTNGSGAANSQFSQALLMGQGQLQSFKDKLLKTSSASGEESMPNFKPNLQKTKTFKQRLEFGTNFQFAGKTRWLPTTFDLALSAGYKLNDRSIIGLGMSSKIGLGSFDRMKFSIQGLGLRSFLDTKLKGNFFITGGWEYNYLLNLTQSPTSNFFSFNNNAWKQSALLGLTKKISVKSKKTKKVCLMFAYDFMYKSNAIASQPIIYRMGYSF